MTEKDREIQRLRGEVEMLREELRNVVQSFKICRYCKHMDADCTPSGHSCNPEWRGINAKN